MRWIPAAALLWIICLGPTLSVGHAESAQPPLDEAEYHVFIVAGQSNSQGYLGNKDEGLNEPVPVPEKETLFFLDGSFNVLAPGPRRIQDVATATRGDYMGARAGFHNEFGRTYHQLTGRKVILVHQAKGDSGIVPGMKYGGGNWPDAHRAVLREKFDLFKKAADEDPRFAGKWALAGLIWGQGEAEYGRLKNDGMTLAELEGHLSNLFDGFVEDYGKDYHGKSPEWINVCLVSVHALATDQSDRFYPDSVLWSATRDMQRHVAAKHPHARMVFFPLERFYTDGVWGPMNAVHYTQKQYNEIGRVMAHEIAKPGSTIHPTKAPRHLKASADGPWRVTLSWDEPEGGVPGELPCYRIYRRLKGSEGGGEGEKSWQWLWQVPGKDAERRWSDESGLLAGTAYEYRVSARNEFGEVFPEEIATVTTGKGATAIVGSLAKEPAAAARLWEELQKAGLTRGLRALYLAGEKFGVRENTLPNLVPEETRADRYDLRYDGNATAAASWGGLPLPGPESLKSGQSVLPINGTFTVLLDVTLPKVRPRVPFMQQGEKEAASDITPVVQWLMEPRDGRVIVEGDRQLTKLSSGPGSVTPGTSTALALGYDGVQAFIQAKRFPVQLEPNTVYFHAAQEAPLRIGVKTSGEEEPMRFHSMAVWNQPLSAEAIAAAQSILSRYSRGYTEEEPTFADGQVTLNYALEGARLEGEGGSVAGFELAGTDEKFHPAQARLEGGRIILRSDAVAHPAMVRYGKGGNLKASGEQVFPPFQIIHYADIPAERSAETIRLGEPEPKEKGDVEVKTTPEGTVYRLSKNNAQFVIPLQERVDGFVFNTPALFNPFFFRRGSIMGYSVDLAMEAEGEDARPPRLLIRMLGAQNRLYWGLTGTHMQGTDGSFRRFHVARLLDPEGPSGDPRTGIHDPKTGNRLQVVALTPPGKKVKTFGSISLRNFSDLTLVRPLVGGELPERIDLGAAAKGEGKESGELSVLNAQKTTLPEGPLENGETGQVATRLYGLADIPATDVRQSVAPIGDQIGVILIGKDAGRFRLVGENATEDGRGIRLIGPDKEPGLAGGPEPEVERFKVRFEGGDPGSYEATLRIVTQATNLRHLSQAGAGEPPIHLYYRDIPVKVTVRP